MKKYLISGAVIVAVFISTVTIFGQPAEKKQQTEQIEKMRQKWQNTPEEEKEQLRPKIQDQIASKGMGLEEQLEAVRTIEEQVAKLKAAIESMIQSRSQYQNASEQKKIEYSKKMNEAAQARRQAVAAIEKEIAGLTYQKPQQQSSEPRIDIRQLKEIHRLALKEKATETAKRLESFMAGLQKGESKTKGTEQGLRKEPAEKTPASKQKEPKIKVDQ